MSKCQKHNVAHAQQDVGRGKWVPVCLQCESERKAAFSSAFAPMDNRMFGGPNTLGSVPFHAECGAYHEEGSCPCGQPKEHNDGDIWLF